MSGARVGIPKTIVAKTIRSFDGAVVSVIIDFEVGLREMVLEQPRGNFR